jgi:curved DNA-binding protein CbpA
MDVMSGERELETLRAWAVAVDSASYYEILGVLDAADDDAIVRAFHRFATAFHPDVQTGAPAEARVYFNMVFSAGAEAYRVLKDPALRARYDQALARGDIRLRPDSEFAQPGPGARRYASLEDLSKSPGARLHARRADAYIGAGDLRSARAELQRALADDGYDNQDLEERLDALALALFATGD